MHRLSDNIPSVFKDAPSNPAESEEYAKYSAVVYDFEYLKKTDFFEHKIESSSELLDLDDDFRVNHIEILERFYHLFESIYKYVKDLLKYLDDLNEGVYIQQTVESVLFDVDGKQLMCEAVYLYGTMLLLLDLRIPGPIRERMLVSYYRYKGPAQVAYIDEVCHLCRRTGFDAKNPKKLKDYPSEYFERYPLPKYIIQMVIGRLRSDDVYNQIQQYPHPDHRSTALATQASMLYVILFFAPEILHKENAIMREVVDKHFADNWVIAYYLGNLVDLSVEWDSYKAAAAAMANTTQMQNIKDLLARHTQAVTSMNGVLQHHLTEGVLTEEYALDHINKLLSILRDANVTLRWIMLHAKSQKKKIADVILANYPVDQVLLLLLNIAQFEFLLREMFSGLLIAKQERWTSLRAQCSERTNELAEYFSGEKLLARTQKDVHLMSWFKDISKQIEALNYQDSTLAGRKIHQLMAALEEVQEFHQVESNLQVRQFLSETRGFLHQMLRTVNVKEQILVTIQLVSDISYAWQLVDGFVDRMQELIKRNPGNVVKLRSVFKKLTTILDLPLMRINESKSADLESVSEYYSGELVAYVRKVLDVIPQSMFVVLNKIIEIQTVHLQEIPTRLEKARLKEFSQLDVRRQLAQATHSVSVFTQGILAMETTLVGTIQVDAKQLLEDGIRKELVSKIVAYCHGILRFEQTTEENFEGRLIELKNRLDGFRRSFEYIQDYVNIYGLKIWQEEFSRIINFFVEQECNAFLTFKIPPSESQYQNRAIPIAIYPKLDNSFSFMGRVVKQMLVLSDPSRAIYVDLMSGWYDKGTLKEIIGLATFSLLHHSIGMFGISGMDQMLAFLNVNDLLKSVKKLRRVMDPEERLAPFLEGVASELDPLGKLPLQCAKIYSNLIANTAFTFPSLTILFMALGQRQLMRRHIAYELKFSCQLDSNTLFSSLDTMNKSLMMDVRKHYHDPAKHDYPGEDNPLIFVLTEHLEEAGIASPFTKIYITTDPIEHIEMLVFAFVISQIPRFQFRADLVAIVANPKPQKKKDKSPPEHPLDGACFIIGCLTFLRQFHSSVTEKFLALLGQYIRGHINEQMKGDSRPGALSHDVVTCLFFLEEFCRYGEIAKKTVELYVPKYILDRYRTMA